MRRRCPGSLGAFMALPFLLLTPAPTPASHRIVLRAVVPPSLSTMRVVSSAGGVARDVTSLGLKVGRAGGEERIAFIRPAFAEDPRRYREYRVVEASAFDNPIAAGFLIPAEVWSAGTPPQVLFEMKVGARAATPADFVTMFQTLLDRDNEPASTTGFLLTGTADFSRQGHAGLLFAVTLEIAPDIRFLGIGPRCTDPRLVPPPPAPQPIPDFLMIWQPTRTGMADLLVNDVPLFPRSVRAQGLRRIETVIPSMVGTASLLNRGDNVVTITVVEDDLAGPQGSTTRSVTVNIADVVCPWHPQGPPGTQQPPR